MFGRVKRLGMLSRRERIKFARRAGETTTRTRIKVEKIKDTADSCRPDTGRHLSDKTAAAYIYENRRTELGTLPVCGFD